MPPLRNRLHVSFWEKTSQTEDSQPREHVLAGIDDLALLYYSGLLAHRPRCAAGLEALLCDYFQLTIQVQQFQGQWLLLDAGNQSTLGAQGQHNQLGVSAVVGQRVWDVQGMFRLRVGPLSIARFTEFLPDWATLPQRKAFFLLVHLVRLYTGLELAFDVQLVLRAADMPPCRLTEDKGIGPRLGWNTWAFSHPRSRDADDACFAGEEVFALN
jgi:type VI secretion system protein ImpH